MSLLSYCYFTLEQFDKSMDIIEKIIKLEPTNAEGYVRKGVLLPYMGRAKEALGPFTKALQLSESTPSKYTMCLVAAANICLILEDWGKALSYAEDALRIDKAIFAAELNKSIALKKLGKEKESLAAIEAILPKITDKYYLACAYAGLEDKQNMLKELDAAIKEDIASRVHAKLDPDFRDYRQDADFRKLVFVDAHK
jgi:tetratricopeptide (TPR) repeat protein